MDYNPQKFLDSIKDKDFWKHKPLNEMSDQEWEALCDGCGKCCLNKLEHKNKILWTNARCRFLDTQSCLCRIYEHRFEKVSDCRKVNLQYITQESTCLPKTCAYRLLFEGKELPSWHPLVTGDAQSTHKAFASVKHRCIISETDVKDYEDHVVYWEDL